MTSTISVPVPATTLFTFLAEPENLPLWAVGFARSVRRDGDRWLALTSGGEIEISMPTDAKAGTIDFHMYLDHDVTATAYSRVVPNGEGAEYVFTQFQSPDMPDDVFAAQARALNEELTVLRGIMAARSACPA